jgi:aminopeptidase
VRRIAASAYRAGCRLVDVMWSDDQVTLARFQHAPRDSFDQVPPWLFPALEEYARAGDAVLSIAADDPDLLKGQDPKLINLALQTRMRLGQAFSSYISRSAINWCVISTPIPSWAAKVFPGLPADQAVEKLWQVIARVCRLDQPDPVAAWQAHVSQMAAHRELLNQRHYHALRFCGPGTDLTIGLPQKHLWLSGQSTSEHGISFLPNIPTEEIFTLPDRNRIEGVVRATLPLSYGGNLIENFNLTFAGGRVVKVAAEKGESILRDLVATDEGSHSLGEVALVPHSSPISQSGVLFFNTLFDENAASHLALGRAYKICLQGAETMTDEEFTAAGGNLSLTHIDFMVGSGEIDLDGIRADGTVEPVMRSGEWAL